MSDQTPTNAEDAVIDLSSEDGDDFSFAFQPVVDVETRSVWAYEALVRGPNGESAGEVLGRYVGDDLHRFDVAAQQKAIELAARLGHKGRLMINILNGSLRLIPDASEQAIDVAARVGMRADQLTFEVSEKDEIHDLEGFLSRVRPSRQDGVDYALDDFGAGFSGLNLLAGFQPNFIKLDIWLVTDIHRNGPRQAIVRGVMRTCVDLGIEVIAEGVESADDFEWLVGAGVRLFQGYLLARPGFEELPEPRYPPYR